jgi:hypothetical protein
MASSAEAEAARTQHASSSTRKDEEVLSTFILPFSIVSRKGLSAAACNSNSFLVGAFAACSC